MRTEGRRRVLNNAERQTGGQEKKGSRQSNMAHSLTDSAEQSERQADWMSL